MLIYVPLNQIEDNPFQKRAIYDNIEELAADILSHCQERPDTRGLQQIPNGRLLMRNSRYPDGLVLNSEQIAKFGVDTHLINDDAMVVQLEFGHRRLRAFRFLQERVQRRATSAEAAALDASHRQTTEEELHEWDYMPVFIRPLTDDQMLDGVWSENRQRRDLSAVEEAELLRDKLERLQANGGGSQREVAESWGLARPTVANRLRLLELPAEIQQANREGKLSERQCLALITVVKIGDVAGDYPDWSNSHDTYGYPAHPHIMVQHAIDNGDSFTSDDIRRYTERALRQAGTELPKPIANFDFTAVGDGDGLQSYTCKGCRYRFNDTCLKRPCLTAKKKLYGERAAKKAAEDLDLPYSDDPEHFSRYLTWKGADERSDLQWVYKAGVSDQVVVGYLLDTDWAIRPYYDGYLSSGEMWDDDGKRLVVIGHKGPIDRDLVAQAQAALMDASEAAGEEIEIEDIPERHEIEEWDKEAKKIINKARKRAKTAVLDKLSYEIADSTTIQALIRAKHDEWLDPEAFLKRFMDFLWDKGSGIPYFYTKTDEIEALGVMLDRAEIGRAVLWKSEVERLTAAAIFVLPWWYEHRKWSNYYHDAVRKLQPLREEFDKHRHEPDLATWSYELDRVWRDVQAKLAVDAEADETAGSQADDERCADCDDAFELVDSVTCSCGKIVCEDCYANYAHDEHDTNEANVELRSLLVVDEEEETAITCQHCGKRKANVIGEPYCDKCWQGELTDHLYCPECKALSTIAKNEDDEEPQVCWSCKAETAKGQWLKNRFTGELAASAE